MKQPPQSEIEIVTLFRGRMRILAPGVAVVAIPNAAKRTQWAAHRAKREGMHAGAPDIICVWPNKGVAWIEFKAEKGRVSENQTEFLGLLERYDHPAIIARSADEAIAFLELCGAPFIGRIAA